MGETITANYSESLDIPSVGRRLHAWRIMTLTRKDFDIELAFVTRIDGER
jgi:hypothetical protein